VFALIITLVLAVLVFFKLRNSITNEIDTIRADLAAFFDDPNFFNNILTLLSGAAAQYNAAVMSTPTA
jgi:hypothetical protein